jgi:hypothetical protein
MNCNYIKPKNEFEQEVMNNIAKITDCMLTNKEIFFLAPDENIEYDILLPVGKKNFIDIDVTDYETAKDKSRKAKGSLTTETLKSQIIVNPSDKAMRLRAELISIVKGFPTNTLKQLKEFSDSRNRRLQA